MGADIADQVTPVPMSPTLGQTLTRAAQYAQEQSHTEVALDHLLLALTEDDDARQVMSSSGVSIESLQSDVSQQIGRIDARLAPDDDATVSISEELRRILNAAAVAARAGRRTMIDGAIVLAAIIGDAKTSAAGLLRAHGLTFEVAINVIRQASQPTPATPPGRATGQDQITQTSASPPQPSSATSDILAQARNQIASRKAAGYSDQVAAKKLADETIDTAGEAQPNPVLEDAADPEPDETPPGTVDDADSLAIPDAETQALESGAAPPSSPSSSIEAPEPPPIASKPTPALRAPPSLPPAPSLQGRQGWAPPPSGSPPTPAGPPPRGAPPPIPAGMPSRPPAPVHTGHHPAADRRPPPGQTAHREPPWTGPPSAPPGQRPTGPLQNVPGANAPMPSPEEVFAANSRARQQADIARTTQRELHPRGSKERPERKRERGSEPSHSPTILPGQLIENVPRRMRVGITSPVEVRIAKAEVKAISEGLDLNATHRHDIQVTKAMSVRLRAPEGGFFIETASPETQWIENALGLMADDYARWRWTVTPKLRGKRRLQLIVSARTVGPDGLAAETALPEQIIEIKVASNYSVLAKRLAGWTIAAVLGGLLAQFGAQAWTGMEPLLRALIQQ